MIKCAIFDADGTLLDSLGIWRKTDEEYILSKGRIFDNEAYGKINTMTYAESIRFVKELYGLEESEEQISDEITALVREGYADVKAVDGAERLLKGLKDRGIPMAVATANDGELIRIGLQSTGLSGYFTRILTCDETGCGKSDAAIFIRAAELFGCRPEDTLVVEDDENYTRAAEQAGFIALHISDIGGFDLEKQMCDSGRG
ncbi:MAG: HAD family phosphatase [Clostridia bacterium]|nr:HAD family phosphatase [Clostridia bacterium]